MPQVQTKAILGDVYPYRLIDGLITDKLKQKVQMRFDKIVSKWDNQLNSEWVLRHYLAAKMIMSATLMINSMDYSIDNNVLITEPYLAYYSLLTTCRSVIYTTPECEWDNGRIITLNHDKIINCAASSMSSLNKQLGEKVKNALIYAKDLRELFSYKFPADGISSVKKKNGNNELVETCVALAEAAQFYSDQLQFCMRKIVNYPFAIDRTLFEKGFHYSGKMLDFIDVEDSYRLEYYVRKQPYPVNLYWTLSEGMVDDFFGAWCSDNEGDEDRFNPDINRSLIFSMP